MKKFIIYTVILLILIAISPIVGNKLVSDYVDDEIALVKKKGITLNFKSQKPGYLYTSRQYEFILSDVDAFAAYITEYGAGMLPPYSAELLKSVIFRLDMKYNNIPFLEPISIDIYPMYISDGIMKKLQGSDNIFFKSFQNFVRQQGLLYHLDYNLLSEDYTGSIKNIDYNEKNYNGSNVMLTLHHAVFNDSGVLQAPLSLQTDIEKIFFKGVEAPKKVTKKVKEVRVSSKKTITQTTQEMYAGTKKMYDKSQDMYDKSKEMYNESGMPKQVETFMQMPSMFFNQKDASADK